MLKSHSPANLSESNSNSAPSDRSLSSSSKVKIIIHSWNKSPFFTLITKVNVQIIGITAAVSRPAAAIVAGIIIIIFIIPIRCYTIIPKFTEYQVGIFKSCYKILVQTQTPNPLIRHLENFGSKYQILKSVCSLESSFGDFLSQ